MKRCLPPVCLAMLLAAGCDSRGGPVGTTERDSAGVRIVEYDVPDSTPAPIRLTELVRVGQAEGPDGHLFSTIAGGVLLGDGSFVVADRDASEVRRFSDAGALLSRHGREGEGPGEYEYIRAMGRCSDSGFTVFDLDWTQNRYTEEASFLDTEPLRLEDGSSPYQLACSPGGRFAATNWDFSSIGTDGIFTAAARLRTLRPDGTREYDLGERVGSDRFGTAGRGSGPHPFGRTTRVAFDGEDLIVADGSFFGYERWSPAGRLEEIVRLDVPAPNLDALVDAHVDLSVAQATEVGGGEVQERTRALRESGELLRGLETAARQRDLRVLGGRVLVQEQAADPAAARWFLFGEDGSPLGWLRLPGAATLLDMNDTRMLVTEVGAMDVPQVVLYEVHVEAGTTTRR